jgi:hypothetical protein
MIVVEGESFLSTSEVASKFGVSPRTILRWHQENPEALGAVVGVNGRLCFRKKTIDETIQKIYFATAAASKTTDGNGTRRSATARRQMAPA